MTNSHDCRLSLRCCCCCCRLTILVVAAGGIACSVLTAMSCDFFRLIASTPADNSSPLDLTTVSNIGIFSYQIMDGNSSGTCQTYLNGDGTIFQPSDWMGTMWIIAQYASLIAPGLAAIASTFTLAEILFGKFCGSFLLPALLYLFACATQGVTFFLYNEEDVCHPLDADDMGSETIIKNSCQLSFGAFLSIVAGFLYYTCSVLLCCLPQPNYHCCSGRCCCSKSPEGEDSTVVSSSQNHKTRTTSSSSENSSQEMDVEQPSSHSGDHSYPSESGASSPQRSHYRPWQQYS